MRLAPLVAAVTAATIATSMLAVIPAHAAPAPLASPSATATASLDGERARARWSTSALAVSPDGSRVYSGGNKFVHWMDATATREISSFQVGNGWIRDLALSKDGKTLYATSDDGILYAASTSPAKILWSVGVGAGPMGMTLTPDGSRAYVANSGAGTVSAVDLVNRKVIATIPVGEVPWDVAASPLGNRVYVAMRKGTGLPQIDTVTNTTLNAIPVGSPSTSVTTDRTGTMIFVATDGTDDLTVINAANGGTLARVPIGPEPTAVVVQPTGQFAFVRERQNGQIVQVSIAGFTVSGRMPTGSKSGDKPEPLVIGPFGSRIYYSLFTAKLIVRATVPFVGPSKPRSVQAYAGVRTARIAWKRPVSTGSTSPILGYRVTATGGGGSCSTKKATTCTITGLQSGKTYRFKVVARTAVGWGSGAWSKKVTIRYPSSSPTPTNPTPTKPQPPVVVVPS